MSEFDFLDFILNGPYAMHWVDDMTCVTTWPDFEGSSMNTFH